MNVPKLRFKEFNDEYKTLKLSDVAELTSSKRIYLSDYTSNGIPFYRGKEISELKLNKPVSDLLYISNEKYEEMKLKYGVPKENEILITGVGTLGNIYRIPNNNKFYFKDGNLIWLKNIKQNSEYLEYNLEFNKKKLLDSAIGSTQKALTIAGLNKLSFNYPSILEQTKIAKTMKLIDKKIELQSKKIEDLKLFTKKVILDILKSEKEYKTKLFKEICTIQTGKSNTQDKDDNGKYPFYIRSENIERSSKYIFDCEAVITIGDGNIGKVFFYENGKFDCHQRVYVLNNFKEVTGKYLYYYFSTYFYKRAISMSAKNTVDSVRMEMISDMKINYPKIEEQNKITKIFDKLEAKQKLEILKLNHLQELKKGLVQNMFV